MEASSGSEPLIDAEIHGFQTVEDLNKETLFEMAKTRWFRPNEVHAILSNNHLFKIEPKPFDQPPSGTLLLFDRRIVRNFRKDGHNWKKKKDGKAVQEAHEKLKVGSEERVHVYYARAEDDPMFYRRCYWLLDKDFDRIVLVHYRSTLSYEDRPIEIEATLPPQLPRINNTKPEIIVSPITPMGSQHSEVSAGDNEINSHDHNGIMKAEFTFDEMNTLDWADILEPNDPVPIQQGMTGVYGSLVHQERIETGQEIPIAAIAMNMMNDGVFAPTEARYVNYEYPTQNMNSDSTNPISSNDGFQIPNTNGFQIPNNNGFATQDNFNTWNSTSGYSPLEPKQFIFSITDVSPNWAYSTCQTKVLVVGYFLEQYTHFYHSALYCNIGGKIVNTERIHPGVYRILVPPNTPRSTDLCLTIDGQTPISQFLPFTYLSNLNPNPNMGTSNGDPTQNPNPNMGTSDGDPTQNPNPNMGTSDGDPTQNPNPNMGTSDGDPTQNPNNSEEEERDFSLQVRLSHLLFSTSNKIAILSNQKNPKIIKEMLKFSTQTSPVMEKYWTELLRGKKTKDNVMEILLKNKLQEWILERIAEGCRVTPLDEKGQGTIHLCAMLNYVWSVRLFASSPFSLDFRDRDGWTPLHWASFLGREKMVATLLSAGANPSLVTDPTPGSPGGSTAADLAAKQGFEGLAAYLAEMALNAHMEAMSLHNFSGPNRTDSKPPRVEDPNFENLSEQELCLKDSLAAFRSAAEAANKIQSAFRERALNLQTKRVRLENTEIDAGSIVAAMKIQNAYRNFERRKAMKAAARIQSHFRTWQTRREFLNMRKYAIKIQARNRVSSYMHDTCIKKAVFRGLQVRRNYKKIIWSVGVLEKAILRWRLKRRGLRGINSADMATAMKVDDPMSVPSMEEDSTGENPVTGEEDFFRISREQAQDRYKLSVVRVQALFRSYRAQQEYRRMKQTHKQASLEFELSRNDTDN